MSAERRAALVAGGALLLMAVLAPLGLLVGLPRGATGLALATVLVVAALDVVVAVALVRALGAGTPLVLPAAALRVAYAVVFVVAGAALLPPADPDRFQQRWDAGLLVFGLHLVMLGAAFVRAAHLPSWVGLAAAVGGLGYVVDAGAVLLGTDPGVSAASVTFVGELVLMVWLLVRGGRDAAAPVAQPVPVAGARRTR